MYVAKILCDLLPIAICLLHDTSFVVDRAGFCLCCAKKHVFQTFHFITFHAPFSRFNLKLARR